VHGEESSNARDSITSLIGHALHVNQLLYGMSVHLLGTVRSILYNIISIPIRKLSFVCICVRELGASNCKKKSCE
jgi:hypothetical protein